MSVISGMGRGASGYSGYNNPVVGSEIFSQSTFTPDYDEWVTNDNFSFINDILTYQSDDVEGNFYQDSEFYNEPFETSCYQFEWTLQNVDAGDLVGYLIGNEGGLLAMLSISNGTHSVEYYNVGETAYTLRVLVEGDGSFEVVSVSLLKKSKGYSGISGDSGCKITPATDVDYADADTLVAQFNTLLANLISAGFMEGAPT